MGEAKRRGGYGVRKAESEAKRSEKANRRTERLRAAEAALTPREHERRRKVRSMLAMAASLAVGA